MTLDADRLARDFRDLLDTGPAGLYELRWLAQSALGADIAPDDRLLPDVLDAVLALTEGTLAWVRWPTLEVERPESLPVQLLPSSVWEDPREGEPLLAVIPAR